MIAVYVTGKYSVREINIVLFLVNANVCMMILMILEIIYGNFKCNKFIVL